MNGIHLLEIVWNFHPNVIPGYTMPAWYGIMWAMGFYLGFLIMNRMFKSEKVPDPWMDKMFIYVLVGGVVGARLGHCLFYDPQYYLPNPIEILKIWEGGLASHGGAVGIILAAYLLNRRVTKTGTLWVLDRLVVPTALTAFLIRMGNLFNHEIVGKPTGTDSGFKFLRHDLSAQEVVNYTGVSGEEVSKGYDMIATDPQFAYILESIPNRYPAQLYEAICYLVIFILLFFLYWKTNGAKIKGFLLGFFFIMIFGVRFVIEFIKENQDGFDRELTSLNMGQYLSIPLVIIGLYFTFRSVKKLKKGKDTPISEE